MKSYGFGTLLLELKKSFYEILRDKVWERILIEIPKILQENLELGAFKSCEIGEISFIKFLSFERRGIRNFESCYTYPDQINQYFDESRQSNQ